MKAQDVAAVVRLDELPGQRAPHPELSPGRAKNDNVDMSSAARVGDVGPRWGR